MNSSAANMNVSALLNLGAKTRADERDVEPRHSNDTFKRHMSDQSRDVKKTTESSAEASSRKSEAQATDRERSAKSAPDSQSQKSSQAEDRQASNRQSETDAEAIAADSDTAQSKQQGQQSTQPESPAIPPEASVDSISPLVADPSAKNGDTASDGGGEVVIDVPANTKISLERLVDAVASGGDETVSEGESANTALDHLVEDLVPIDSAGMTSAATVSTPVAADAATAAVTQMAPAARQHLNNQKTMSETPVGDEIDALAPALDSKSAGLESKPVATKAVELFQLAENMPRPNQQTLNQQVASSVQSVVQELAKEGQVKNDASGSLRDVSPLVATTQRAASRPINVQQGNAQFTMPNQTKAGQPQWQTAVAERVAIMATQRITSAEIQLDPPELGQLQVRVTLNQEQASVSFASQHAVVREALDQTAQKLRDMFDAEGLNLVDVDVSDQSFQQQNEGGNGSSGQGDSGADQDEDAQAPVLVKISEGLVDQFV